MHAAAAAEPTFSANFWEPAGDPLPCRIGEQEFAMLVNEFLAGTIVF